MNGDQKDTNPTIETGNNPVPNQKENKKIPRSYIIIAVVAVIIGLLLLLFAMEREDKINTNFFAPVEKYLDEMETVVKVNDEAISKYEYDTIVNQIIVGATAQGIDTNNEEIQNNIKEQAINTLVNTALLQQAATERGINVSEEDVNERLTELEQEIGGKEVLDQRMEAFGVTEETLREDIRSELTIQVLLDQIFAEQTIEVTEEEVTEFYESAGGSESLPPLEEVRAQIELEIRSAEEQEIIDQYLTSLRENASIEILI